MVVDGNEACAYVAYAFSEVAAIYPITPSSPMAGKTDEWSANGRKNLFTQPVTLVEMQSEAGAIGAVHGALEAGSLATSFTSSQGLMLMIPVLHRISGTKQPAVLHVASRTVGTHAMSIFGDHSDVMNCRQTGFAMLSTGSVQEVMDLAGVAHLAAIKARIPFMHFFDGFRTSHEIQKIRAIPYEVFSNLLDWGAVRSFRESALNPYHPSLRNTVQNPDVYFQFREANNRFYDGLPEIVEDYMQKINEYTGEDYHIFNYYGAPDAERVVVAMGSVSGAAREAVACLNAQGEKVGYLQVHLFNPFSKEFFLKALPKTVKKIAVLDRCKEMGAAGDPLYLAVCSAFINEENKPFIIGGRYGLSSKDTTPEMIAAVFTHLTQEDPFGNFTIGINDDVTHRSLPIPAPLPLQRGKLVSCKFWGLGSDGTVGANKNSIKIIGDHTPMYTQAYFEYDTKKSFGITRSHLRFGDEPIRGAYLVHEADFIACHNQSFLNKYDMLSELKPGGVFLLNCRYAKEELGEKLPANVKRALAEKKAKLYIIDANKIAQELGLGDHASMVLQSAFFSLADIIPMEEAIELMKEMARKSFGKKGDAVVQMNLDAIDRGAASVVAVEIPKEWKDAQDPEPVAPAKPEPDFIKNILRPINALKGDDLPVSTFIGYEDGTMPLGTTAYEKRGIATHIPVWNAEVCAQCNRCSFVCPHAVIRPYLLTEEEKDKAPEGFVTVPAKGKGAEGMYFSIQVSDMDCTGCGSCVKSCPLSGKALHMELVTEELKVTPAWEYGLTLSDKKVFRPETVKGSQFRQPLCEFNGACAGCGETPYVKLVTQLFGDRMVIANATGCSSIYGGSAPTCPYTTDENGHGPAWANSLFEDNAEFGFGMNLGITQRRAKLAENVKALAESDHSDAIKAAANEWLENMECAEGSKAAGAKLVELIKDACCDTCKAILADADLLTKKSFWIFGGDGWAYDIGYGGLDHVLAQGEDVNVLVLDTEVYSNTGGQASKSSPHAAVAKFAAAGKRTKKKDLGMMAMSYGYVYVAQVAMSDPAQVLKAMTEAEAYHGPSLIIAYAPCINHGIRMNQAQLEIAKAVEAGYWQTYRFNPAAEKKFTLDSKPPKASYQDFIKGENRYASLLRQFPDVAPELFDAAQKDAEDRLASYQRLAAE